MKKATSEFDLRALYDAIDQRRRSRRLSWTEVANEVNHFRTGGHPIAPSTIRGLESKAVAEGDGVLQMLLWLGRTPESFVSGVDDADAGPYRIEHPGPGRLLRWDAKALYSALNAQRQARGLTWGMVAQQVGGFTPGMLTRLANGGRVGFPGVMRIVQWLERPAAAFMRASYR
jgi:hypothetical protein